MPDSYVSARSRAPRMPDSREHPFCSLLNACVHPNALQLHLATCDSLWPHVSLMNYTYLPSSQYSAQPAIVMTTNPASKKTINLINNPRVSLLVHDWVSHRPP